MLDEASTVLDDASAAFEELANFYPSGLSPPEPEAYFGLLEQFIEEFEVGCWFPPGSGLAPASATGLPLDM